MRIQLQKKDIKHEFHGSVDAGIKIYKKYGLKGLYLGFCPTLLREVIALGLFFTSYDWLMRFYSDDGHPANAHIVTAFFAGGIAGGSSWLFTYPIDYIKTLIQS